MDIKDELVNVLNKEIGAIGFYVTDTDAFTDRMATVILENFAITKKAIDPTL